MAAIEPKKFAGHDLVARRTSPHPQHCHSEPGPFLDDGEESAVGWHERQKQIPQLDPQKTRLASG